MENIKINDELSNFPEAEPTYSPVHEKLDDFLSLLADSPVDNKTLQELQQKFNQAIRSAADSTALQPYIKGRREMPDEDLDSEVGQLFFLNQVDEKTYKQNSLSQIINKIVRLIISLLLILLGFGMIIMPAPPYFEMFTLFYLNPNDGVTIMDVISLIVAFTGVYLLISTITKLRGK